MNTIRNILIGAVALSAVSSAAFAQSTLDSNQAEAAVNASVVAALTVTNTAGLQFGTIVRPQDTATISVSTAGVFDADGTTALPGSTTPTAAAFDVEGVASQTYSVTVGTVSLTNGSTVLPVTTEVSTLSALDSAGEGSFTVGGEFTLTSASPLGAYTGTMLVTVDYN
jgi:hypothetical protein